MPSKEEMCVLASSNTNTTTQDFMARDVEELVSEIKENLRLSGFKSRPTFSVHHKSRASPYRIPSRSWGDSACEACAKTASKSSCSHTCMGYSKKATSESTTSDDPYEMLQELLSNGSLIKEAVRRLSKCARTPKQRYYYDSDEEPRSPLRMCHLEI
ncbi:hypothetical protein R5R35_001326 [Gryllus longicercus]|uniref:Uncharacterized protein n=1 Tax=Gryllus longicercus TaxID=2509291 RepID=A0AAN9VCE9_9ORTH